MCQIFILVFPKSNFLLGPQTEKLFQPFLTLFGIRAFSLCLSNTTLGQHFGSIFSVIWPFKHYRLLCRDLNWNEILSSSYVTKVLCVYLGWVKEAERCTTSWHKICAMCDVITNYCVLPSHNYYIYILQNFGVHVYMRYTFKAVCVCGCAG